MGKQNSTEFILNGAILQDTLLQSYRSFHLILQSIFVAVGAGLSIAILSFERPVQAYLALIILAAIFTLSIYLLLRMRKIIVERGNDVNYWHRELIKAERSHTSIERFFTRFKIHQQARRRDVQHLEQLFLSDQEISDSDIDQLIQKGLGHTRRVIDLWLFLGLGIIWLIILGVGSYYTIAHFLAM